MRRRASSSMVVGMTEQNGDPGILRFVLSVKNLGANPQARTMAKVPAVRNRCSFSQPGFCDLSSQMKAAIMMRNDSFRTNSQGS